MQNKWVSKENKEVKAIDRKKHTLNIVIEIKLLGTILTEDGEMDQEINIWCSKADQVLTASSTPTIQGSTDQHKEQSHTKHINSYLMLPLPNMDICNKTYAIVTMEMTCLRKAARRDKIKNEIVRERTEIESILKYIQRQLVKWFVYPKRMF